MSAVMKVREHSAEHLSALQPPLVQHFELMATAPSGVAKLRELILTQGVRGKLLPQDPSDEPASELLEKIQSEKDRLIEEGKIKRGKPLAEIPKQDEPFSLPHGWVWVRLNSLLQKIGAGSTPLGGREVYVPNGVKFLRSQNVWNDGLRLDSVAFIKPGTHAKMNGTVVFANDLLFNITGASIGRCAVVPSNFDEANVSQHVTIVRTVMPELNEFLHKVLISRHVQQTVMDVQVGVSREGLSIAKLGQFLIPLPPLAEQSRIVTRVEELMRLCDALEANGRLEDAQHAQLVQTLLAALTASTTPDELADNWQRVATHFDLLLDRPEAVDALEQTILQLAVRGLLVPQDPREEPASELVKKIRAEKYSLVAEGKIKSDKSSAPVPLDGLPFGSPTGWSWVRLGDVWQSSFYGPRFSNEEYVSTGGIPTIRTTDMTNGQIVLRNPPRVNVPLAKYDSYLVRKGDLLVTRSGSIGVMALFDLMIDAVPSAYLIRIRFSEHVYPNFFLKYFQSELGQKQLGLSTTSVGVPNVSASKMAEFFVPLPPLAEQVRIVARVESLRRVCNCLRERLVARQTTQVLLADALIGEVA
ncbi:type I restriction modification DNA specificity domain protein [Hydrogenophaga sp. RAC07]|uniref:restriction endonuclease subunit S n=1 Tax=Hydrogenophaga sp. RAC07 TaxID=1842537 RepID=UPI000858244F|nr:restriction endonuclease subunit S [Hydrogenophaga sp. RAC07]AOF86981.1 type I restriction modification DNA specificity domain protein [Hydrogenophaga sp. RAC07]